MKGNTEMNENDISAVLGGDDDDGDSEDLLGGAFGESPAPPGDDSVDVKAAQFTELTPGSAPQTKNNIDMILDISVPVAVELGRAKMLLEDVLSLTAGSVVELDKLAGEPVDLLVHEKVVAQGEVVVVDENFGIRVTEIVSPEQRVKSLK